MLKQVPLYFAIETLKLTFVYHLINYESNQTDNRNRTPIETRHYILCNVNDVEDEYLFVLVCPALNELRKIY